MKNSYKQETWSIRFDYNGQIISSELESSIDISAEKLESNLQGISIALANRIINIKEKNEKRGVAINE